MYYLIESAPDKDRVVAKSHDHDEIVQECLDAQKPGNICDYYITKRVTKF